MHEWARKSGIAAILLAGLISGSAAAKLPPPTPEQQQEAAAKKAQAAAQAEKEKQELAASMDGIAARWRAKASANGWKTYPPVAVTAAPGASTSGAQAGPSGQPGGRLGDAAGAAPIRSEKWGTAPPSTDVKQPAKQAPPDKIK